MFLYIAPLGAPMEGASGNASTPPPYPTGVNYTTFRTDSWRQAPDSLRRTLHPGATTSGIPPAAEGGA